MGIATNTRGQFLIADNGDKTVKVFDSNGNFDFRFNPQTDDPDTKLVILDVATAGEDDKIYLLVRLEKPCLLYTSPSPRDGLLSRMPSSA